MYSYDTNYGTAMLNKPNHLSFLGNDINTASKLLFLIKIILDVQTDPILTKR